MSVHVLLLHGKQRLLKASFAESVIGSGFTKCVGRTGAKKEGSHQRTGPLQIKDLHYRNMSQSEISSTGREELTSIFSVDASLYWKKKC